MTTAIINSPPTVAQLQLTIKNMTDAAENLHDSLFSQCCSNPIFNTWGKEVDLTAFAQLQDATKQANKVLAACRSENN